MHNHGGLSIDVFQLGEWRDTHAAPGRGEEEGLCMETLGRRRVCQAVCAPGTRRSKSADHQSCALSRSLSLSVSGAPPRVQ